MGTRADYYVGRGLEAEWLGSTAWDGYPASVFFRIKEISLLAGGLATEAGYRSTISAFLAGRDGATLPEQGWPWPWKDSQTTDYSYAFDDGRVWASCFGYGWFDPDNPPTDDEGEEDHTVGAKVAVFPDMTTRQKVTRGSRSGIMLIRVDGPVDAKVIDAEEAATTSEGE